MATNVKSISKAMKRHHSRIFNKFGPTPRGVDWSKEEDLQLRYAKMLAVCEHIPFTLLDVGCGYGGLYLYAQQNGLKLQYTGIDLVPNMITWAKEHMPDGEFIEADFLEFDFDARKFDYVVCNGVLTQKLKVSFPDMDAFAKGIIRKMFAVCNHGVAFNVMSTYVNYVSYNLYYKHPSEMLAYYLSELSSEAKLDHSYGLYEFTLYLYKRGEK